MTAFDADAGALGNQYRDLRETARRAEVIRYSATLSDGAPVNVLVIGPELTARIRHPQLFLDALERASRVKDDAVGRPLAWGRASNGLLHCAYARAPLEEVTPGTQSAGEVARVGARLARGLGAAHNAGMFHGAICTDRIAQASPASVQLSEFGLFAAIRAGGADPREVTAALCGSAYVSPEQEHGREPDERCDIYSLGASLFELLTGKPPFGGRTTSYTMATVLAGRDSALPGAGSDSHVGVVNALLRAIEKAPDDRWPSASAFANALETGTSLPASGGTRSSKRGFFAIFLDAWFPARRSRE
jgi:hypothetical protein